MYYDTLKQSWSIARSSIGVHPENRVLAPDPLTVITEIEFSSFL